MRQNGWKNDDCGITKLTKVLQNISIYPWNNQKVRNWAKWMEKWWFLYYKTDRTSNFSAMFNYFLGVRKRNNCYLDLSHLELLRFALWANEAHKFLARLCIPLQSVQGTARNCKKSARNLQDFVFNWRKYRSLKIF